ncbi:WYL domain-containing protein [Methylomicrobium sp. Wu6]|uniref:helix-turn-helix transcriptional regulator n=1 Tax=Methylomicrobium sp. Wu6 TaxID=3107928 RepID=UPI002DD67417|nr:WYL domain-containing protein [Methylomicrobium sp. Wu6]MEC4747530.1 WYL domain-containing protein [Methylomicrobium sp. Wu6]
MSPQMVRLLQILAILPRYPENITTERIKKTFEYQEIKISMRQIQRDMLTLEAAFPDKIGSQKCRDRTVRWYWLKDAPSIRIAGLTISQALSLKLLEKFLTPLFPKATLDDLELFFEEAGFKLQEVSETPLAEWPKKIAIVQPTQPLLMPEVLPEVQGIVSEALLKDRQLRVHYRHSNGELGDYDLNPLGLVLRNGSIYLIASKVGTKVPSIFALHRIQRIEPLDDPAVRPTGFDLQQFIDTGRMGFNFSGEVSYQPIKLVAIFDPITTNHLSESRLSEDQVIDRFEDGSSKITATVQDTEQLFWWLQSFGARVEVLEPESLRKKMADSVRVLAKKYQID